ncbi:MAG: 50S ribosomal protein L4 [Clostridia bacterium]|nr:50S ribosomal protein L4 [Clostridia bacterium]
MADIKVYDMKAKEVGSVALPAELFSVEYNEPVIHQVVVAENANARQGTKSTLTVSEVRGHHKKPYAQKHTGNARHGNTKAPQYKGGGIVHAMKPRDFTKKVNKQVKFLAFASALSQKLNQNEITVIDEINFENPKTKAMMEMLNAFKFDRKTVIVLDDNNEKVLRAGANIPFLSITTANLLNVGEIVANKNLVFTKSAIKKLEEVRI